jgi:formate dehydrogenase
LECFFDDVPIRAQYLIVQNGELAGAGAHSYSKGTATDGSEEAEKYKK